MPPLDSFSPRVSPSRFESVQREGRKPYRKFRSRHYQSLDDQVEDHDDLQSFSSLRLAKDQDKPTKKYLGTWKKKNTVRQANSSSQSYFGNYGFSSLGDSSFDQEDTRPPVPRDVTAVFASADKTTNIVDNVSSLNFFPSGQLGNDIHQFSPNSLEAENRHPQNFFQLQQDDREGDKSNNGTIRPALRSLNSTHGGDGPEFEPDSTQDQFLVALRLVRLKKELKKMKQESASKAALMRKQEELEEGMYGAGKKTVRFCTPLVTSIAERPFTEEEDMDKLYFVHGELEELEWDRSTVENDQFECILEEEDHCAFIEVEHTSRKLHLLDAEGLPHSMSDLSFY